MKLGSLAYAPPMRILVTLSCALALAIAPSTLSGARVSSAIDECTLVTNAQARKIMQAKPYSDGAPDNGGCSWETDPYDRQHLAFVTVKVERRATVLARYSDDLRSYLDESTNVGIDPLPDVGDEAFTGPGASSGIYVAVADSILSIEFQPLERVENPSPAFSRIVKIVKKVVAKVRKA